ncbi:MAG: hypothetical protein J1E05_02715 [Eubacterium sp.]|nr:hypothetical protein [Eubacterium sp.]
MKKALIIFAVLFALTLAIPAIAAFVNPPAEKTGELVTLFAEGTTNADENA